MPQPRTQPCPCSVEIRVEFNLPDSSADERTFKISGKRAKQLLAQLNSSGRRNSATVLAREMVNVLKDWVSGFY